jgi:hypothetical protein
MRKGGKRIMEKEGPKDTIKIRYVFLAARLTKPDSLEHYPLIKYKVLTLGMLENKGSRDLEETLTDTEGFAPILILRRDLYTGRVDKYGKEIYKSDRIKWFTCGGDFFTTVIDNFTDFSTSIRNCEVVGNIYDTIGSKEEE